MNRSSRRRVAALPGARRAGANCQAEETPIPTVAVKASNTAYDPRRADTASKTVIGQ